MLHVGTEDECAFLEGLSRHQHVAVQSPGGAVATPELRAAAHRAAARRQVAVVIGTYTSSASELVEAGQTARGADSKQLPAELVVGKLGDQELMLADSTAEPAANVRVSARVTDSAENTCVQQ